MITKPLLLFFCLLSLSAASNNITTYTYKTIGDLSILLDVYTPPSSAPSTGYPILFAIHGGAYCFGDKTGAFTDQELTEIMNRGWIMVSIDYRLVPGAFLQDIIEDIQDAYAWVHTELSSYTPVNTELITIFGQSAGGGLAVLSGFKLSPRPKAVIGFYPGFTNWTEATSVYNPKTPVNPVMAAAANKLSVPVVSEYTGSATDPKQLLWEAGQKSVKLGWLVVTHDPDMPTEEVLERLRGYSATENVDDNDPPTYLAHGLDDNVVPCLHSVQLAGKLQEKNITHVIDLVPNAGHGFDFNTSQWEQHILPAFDFAQKYMEIGIKLVDE